MPKRQRVTSTDNWHQLELRFTSPEQRTYELIRPAVLFGQAPAERAQKPVRHSGRSIGASNALRRVAVLSLMRRARLGRDAGLRDVRLLGGICGD